LLSLVPREKSMSSDFLLSSSSFYHIGIQAPALYGWILRRKSFFYVRAYSRRFTMAHRVYRDDAGAHVIPVQLPDLFMHYLIYAAEDSSDSALRRMDYEIMQMKRTYFS